MQTLILLCFAIYTALLFLITWLTSRKANNQTYFTGNRKSPWFVVAYGMIGSSLSGVTFMSVPGDVATTSFTYFCVVLGYILGYLAIAFLLLPLYYRLRLTSIYEYLNSRIGNEAHKTGSILFIISRLLGSALRMYLVIYVLHFFVFSNWGIPIWATAIVMILIILLYTFQGGLKTVVWTDTLQTTFMIAALIMTIVAIFKDMQIDFGTLWRNMEQQGLNRIFETDWHKPTFYLKQILGGMFITIAMTGLDQDMMQKNLSCKSLKDARKNMLSFTGILVFVNALFLLLGGLLILYAQQKGIDLAGMPTDRIYPELAFHYLGAFTSIVFVIGLISAGYSSADGTFTALTTSICYDIIHIEKRFPTSRGQLWARRYVHFGISLLFLAVILVAAQYHNDALIRIIFTVAGYTYGPLLGLFAFGMFTKRNIKYPILIPIFAIIITLLCLLLSHYSEQILWGYKFGFELLIVNGTLQFLGLLAISERVATTKRALPFISRIRRMF